MHIDNLHIIVCNIMNIFFCTVGLKIEIYEIHQNLRNPMCIINKNPPSATKSTCMKRKLSKSIVSRHENEKLPRNPVLLTKSTHSAENIRLWSWGDFYLINSPCTPTSAYKWGPDNVGGWHHWFISTLRKLQAC